VHIRINIPDWGAKELARGVLSFARGGYADALTQELQAFAPDGWRPHLLASARYGLALAAQQLGVKRIAVPGYVCPAVLTGLRAADAEIVPVDVAPGSFRFDPDALANTIRAGRADALLAANTYGLDQDFAFLRSLNLPIIEDAAYQAGCVQGSKSGAQPCGFRGDAGVWSFNFKSLAGVGGGILWLPETGSRFKVQGSRFNAWPLFANYAVRAVFRERLPKFLGGAAPPGAESEHETRAVLQEMRGGPMSELQAALALTQWRRRDTLAARQKANADALERALANCAAFAPVADTVGQTKVHLFPFLVNGGPEAVLHVRRALYAQGVQTETPYPVLLGDEAKLPNAHGLAARLALAPCHASLREKRVKHIAGALLSAWK
jgi:dTDP-4-amino-4,6-dideoxygalactose transaminase